MKVFIILFQVALVGAQSQITKVTAYVDDAVVLPSGAAESETLQNIEWSIFSNNTMIATYSNEVTNLKWFYQFNNRLSLNSSSGNLRISNVKLSDALVYKVDRIGNKGYKIHKVDLTVRERLQKPTITAIGHPSDRGHCFALHQCSSPDQGVALSWEVSDPGVFVSNQTVGRDVVLLAVISKTLGNVQLSCTARKASDHASSSITTDCPGDSSTEMTSLTPGTVQPRQEIPRCRDLLAASLGFFFGSLFGAVLYFCLNCLQKCVQSSS